MNKSEKSDVKLYIFLFMILTVVIIAVIAIYLKADQKSDIYTVGLPAMGTKMHQTIYGDNGKEVSELAKEAVNRLEESISHEIDGSDIDRINSGAGIKWVKIDESTINIMDRVIDVSSRSRHTFDPTFLSILSLWGFDSGKIISPQPEEIKNTLQNVDYRNIEINHNANRIKLNNEKSLLTLCQIDRGAACEAVIDVYRNSKIKYGIASVGNTVGVYGRKPNQAPWKISIKNPLKPVGDTPGIASVKINNGYVTTLGLPEKMGKDSDHRDNILDIRNGYPVKNNILSITIVHSDAVIACALSTICYTLGQDESFSILNYYGAEAIYVYDNYKIHVTPNLASHFSIINPEYEII